MAATGSLAEASAGGAGRRWPCFVSVKHGRDALVIRYRWLRGESIASLLILPLFMPGIIVMTWTGALTSPQLFMKFFGVVAIGLILCLLYIVAANVVNASVLRITPDRLEAKSGPLPWIAGNLIFPVVEIAAVSCREKIHYEAKTSYTDYSLQLITRSGREFPILRAFAKREDAEAMRALIVEQLGGMKATPSR